MSGICLKNVFSVRSLELLKEAYVIFREHAQVFDLIFQVGDSFNTHAEGEAGVDFGVYAAGFKHIWIDHAAAENLDPAGVFAERATLSATEVAGDVHFGRGFSEREVARTQADLGFRSEHFAGKVEQSLAQVGERDVFVNVESLHLMEEAVGAGRDGFVAVDTSGTDDADWRLGLFHHAALHG